MSTPKIIQIHLLTNCQIFPDDKYLKFIEVCIKSGITHVQLRQKNWAYDDLISFGRELKAILQDKAIPLIINDNFELMMALNAEGVHLGQTDSNPVFVRNLIGQDKIIGLSIETTDQLLIANQLDCIDYVAASSIFPTTTKKDLKTIWGVERLKLICQLSRHQVIAIGGINDTNVKSVYQAGVAGIALISAIHDAKNPELYIRKLVGYSK